MNEKTIAIIPARSGSKGLPGKNIKKINNIPLLAYSVIAAKECGLFDTIHVSTDSSDYSQIASSYGADQPFLREPDTSGDSSSTWDAVREVVKKYEKIGKHFDVCVLLQPTSPLRTAEDIIKAFELFERNNARAVVSVTEVDHPVQWCFPLDETNSMRFFSKSPFRNSRRQDLEKNYRENGSIYIVHTNDILNPDFDIYSAECFAYIMDQSKSIDIDTLTDFKVAEVLMQNNSEDI